MFAARRSNHRARQRLAAIPLLGVLALLGVSVLPTAAVGRPNGESPADAVARAQTDANRVAGDLRRRMTEVDRLDTDITASERKAQAAEQRIAALRARVGERAAALYRRSGAEAFSLETDADLANLLDQLRAQFFAVRANEQERADVNALRDSVEQLRSEQNRLKTLRKSAAAQRRELEKLNGEIQRKLTEAKAAKERADADAAASAKAASNRGRGSSSAPVFTGPAQTFNGVRCPIAGPVAFSNDWGDPRSGGRRHAGTDLFSPQGTPNVAVMAGSVFRQVEAVGGISVYLRAEDGNTYYYTHLSGYAGSEGPVGAGQVIGYTGGTGNANGVMHTHFEIRLGGPNGTRVNPYPTLARVC